MKNKKMFALIWILSFVPLISIACVYPMLPEQVPMQWGFDGAINRYGNKSELWLLGGISVFFTALMLVVPKIDPRKENYQRFQGYYDSFVLVMTLFFCGMMGSVLVETMRPGTLSMGRIVSAMMGLLLAFIGNLMGKIKPNFFFGIRTPWTLSDPDVWNRTHRLGGRLWFFIGILLIPCALLLPENVLFVCMMAGILGSTLYVTLMSYIWYRQLPKK